jgi:hypothetical protein
MTKVDVVSGKNSEPATNHVKHLPESTNGRKTATRGNPRALGIVYSLLICVPLYSEEFCIFREKGGTRWLRFYQYSFFWRGR